MIIENDGVILEANTNGTAFWIMLHNNTEGQTLMEYEELTIELSDDHINELIKILNIWKDSK